LTPTGLLMEAILSIFDYQNCENSEGRDFRR
jgi:hypothetical protein